MAEPASQHNKVTEERPPFGPPPLAGSKGWSWQRQPNGAIWWLPNPEGVRPARDPDQGPRPSFTGPECL
jgi:hypothetical protein